MEKHKKLEAGINHINHKELKKIKIIHLKTTPSKNGITHFYWNNKLSELIIGAKYSFLFLLLHILSIIKNLFLIIIEMKFNLVIQLFGFLESLFSH